MTLNCDLVSLHGWAMGSTHHFTEANIWPKLKENPSRGEDISSGHQIQGSNSRPWTVTLSLRPMAELWVLHIVPQVNIWPKFRENLPRGKGDTERTRNSRLKPMTLNCDLDHGWVIDSAHRLTKVNIWPKFIENPSTGIGDTERT